MTLNTLVPFMQIDLGRAKWQGDSSCSLERADHGAHIKASVTVTVSVLFLRLVFTFAQKPIPALH